MDQNNIYDNKPDAEDNGSNNNNVPEGYTAPDTSYGYESDNTGSTQSGTGSFTPNDNSGNNTSGYNNHNTNYNNTGYNSGSHNTQGSGYTPHNDNIDVPGKSAATASLVLGIISIVAMATWTFGIGSCVGIITGIIGLICSSNAKREGYTGGMQTGGFICSLIGLIGGAFVLVACVACVGFIGTFGALNEF